MKLDPRTVLVALLAFALAVTLLNTRHPHDPVYRERTLSAWLEDLMMGRDGLQHDQAEEAVRTMGTNALPLLCKLLASEESRLDRNLRYWLNELPGVHYQGKPVLENHEKALRAFAALGPIAKPAIPELKRLLDASSRKNVAELLMSLGPEGESASNTHRLSRTP